MYKVQTFALKISNPEYVLVIYTLMAPIFGGLLKRPQEVLHAATFAINSAIAQEVLQGVEDICFLMMMSSDLGSLIFTFQD